MEITFYIVLVGAIVFNLFALGEALFNGDLSGYWRALGHGEYLLTVLLLGLLSTALSSFFNNNALQQLSASKVSVFNNLSPIVSLFGGVLLLGETLRGYHIVGTILVILGVVGMNRRQGKRVRK